MRRDFCLVFLGEEWVAFVKSAGQLHAIVGWHFFVEIYLCVVRCLEIVVSQERRLAMRFKNNPMCVKIGMVGIVFLMMACNLFSSPIEPLTPTPTPTPVAGGAPEEKLTPTASRCDGLSGELEMQVLVGPAEVVGLEPFAVGGIPFTVVSDGEAYIVEGGGEISYEEILSEEWGTYTVSLDMEGTIDGECRGADGSEELDITIEMSGEQMVEVRAEGFQGDYPWAGTHELTLSFPLEDGAISEGEGWAFVLHLNK